MGTSPPAKRLRRVRPSDLRLWLGILLVVGAMAAGAALLARDDGSVSVWQATADLPVGARPAELAGALVPVRVRLGSAADAYLRADTPVAGALAIPVRAGSLVPAAALATAPAPPVRLVTVPVDPLHAPSPMAPGSVVDLWATPEGAPAQLVHAGAMVASVADQGFGDRIGVVLQIPEAEVAPVVAAARTGAIDLVQVPG